MLAVDEHVMRLAHHRLHSIHGLLDVIHGARAVLRGLVNGSMGRNHCKCFRPMRKLTIDGQPSLSMGVQGGALTISIVSPLPLTMTSLDHGLPLDLPTVLVGEVVDRHLHRPHERPGHRLIPSAVDRQADVRRTHEVLVDRRPRCAQVELAVSEERLPSR